MAKSEGRKRVKENLKRASENLGWCIEHVSRVVQAFSDGVEDGLTADPASLDEADQTRITRYMELATQAGEIAEACNMLQQILIDMDRAV